MIFRVVWNIARGDLSHRQYYYIKCAKHTAHNTEDAIEIQFDTFESRLKSGTQEGATLVVGEISRAGDLFLPPLSRLGSQGKSPNC